VQKVEISALFFRGSDVGQMIAGTHCNTSYMPDWQKSASSFHFEKAWIIVFLWAVYDAISIGKMTKPRRSEISINAGFVIQ